MYLWGSSLCILADCGLSASVLGTCPSAPAENMNKHQWASSSLRQLLEDSWYSCLAKLISGCLSVADGDSNSPCFTEGQKAFHCPPQPILGAQPPLTDPVLAARLFDLLCSSALSIPGGKWWSQLSSAAEVCNALFVQTSPLARETPKHMYSSQSCPWGN